MVERFFKPERFAASGLVLALVDVLHAPLTTQYQP